MKLSKTIDKVQVSGDELGSIASIGSYENNQLHSGQEKDHE